MWETSIEIGEHTLKNRIVYPPLSTNWGTRDGGVTDKIVAYYREQAEGGCAMVIAEGSAVSVEGRGSSNSLAFESDRKLDGFRDIAAAITEHGCIPAIQLLHAGGQANPTFTGYEAVSPSGVPCQATGCSSRALETAEVAEIRERFVNSALLAERAGFKVVELHAAHGYLLHEFLAPITNLRTDKYGGNADGRSRLLLEIIGGIRKKAPSLTLGVRISGEDFRVGGIDHKENAVLLPLLERAGIAYFHVTAGVYDTGQVKHEAMLRGEFFNFSRYVKSLVGKPVIGVGKILDIEQAEVHLTSGNCDLVAIGRGLLADPKMVEKVRNKGSFNRCIECRRCMYLRYGREYLRCPVRKV